MDKFYDEKRGNYCLLEDLATTKGRLLYLLAKHSLKAWQSI
jgi:hypothetical protein